MKKIYLLCVFSMGLFMYSAAQVIDLVGVGSQGNPTPTITIVDPGNVTHLKLDAIYKASGFPDSLPGPIHFIDGPNDYSVDFNEVTGDYYKSSRNDRVGYYLKKINNYTGGDLEMNSSPYENEVKSFSAFVFRDLSAPDSYSMASNKHVYFWHNGVDDPFIYKFKIKKARANRDITVNVMVTDAHSSNDTRIAVIKATAGDIEDSLIISNNQNGNYLDIEPIVLENVDKNIKNVKISVYSPKSNGDSFVTGGAVVTVEMGLNHCTYTQGFYGNCGGQNCDGESTKQMLERLLKKKLIVGGKYKGKQNRVVLKKADVDCLIDKLPGGGPSKSITGDHTACDNNPGIQYHKNGRYKNTLLAQTITLGLNLRYDPTLGFLPLNNYLVTLDAEDCGDPYSDPVEGTEQTFEIGEDVVNYLINHNRNSINGLFWLANRALKGKRVGSLGLSQITDALAAINEGFDECRVLDGFYENEPSNKSSLVNNDNGNQYDNNLSVYPNPVYSTATIDFTANEDGYTTVDVYNMLGEKVDVLMNKYMEEDSNVTLSLNVHKYQKGLYIVVIRNGSSLFKQKITITN